MGARFGIGTRLDGRGWRRSNGDPTGIRRSLEAAGIRVLAETSSAVDAVSPAPAHRPDACLSTVGRLEEQAAR